MAIFDNYREFLNMKVAAVKKPRLPDQEIERQIKELLPTVKKIKWVENPLYNPFYSVIESPTELSNEELDKLALILCEVGRLCMPSPSLVEVSRKPKVLKVNDIFLLHSTTGPALIADDGRTAYAINGVRVPDTFAWAFEPNKELTKERAHEILNIQNVETRARLINLVGIVNLIEYLNAVTIDEAVTENNHVYQLLKFKLPTGDDTHAVYLKMTNPSTGEELLEAVHPDTETIEEAIYFRANGKLPTHDTRSEFAVEGFPIQLT